MGGSGDNGREVEGEEDCGFGLFVPIGTGDVFSSRGCSDEMIGSMEKGDERKYKTGSRESINKFSQCLIFRGLNVCLF